MYYEFYREESSNLWRWTLYGEDDRKMAESVEKDCNKAVIFKLFGCVG